MTEYITEEIIEKWKSKRGGWDREHLALLGIQWPPVAGWRQSLMKRIQAGERIPILPIAGFLMRRRDNLAYPEKENLWERRCS